MEARAIRELRAASNLAIERGDLAAIASTLSPDSVLVAGNGSVESGIETIKKGWAEEFADPGYIRYARTPKRVEVADGGARAAESGTWMGMFDRSGGQARPHGTYFVHWVHAAG